MYTSPSAIYPTYPRRSIISYTISLRDRSFPRSMAWKSSRHPSGIWRCCLAGEWRSNEMARMRTRRNGSERGVSNRMMKMTPRTSAMIATIPHHPVHQSHSPRRSATTASRNDLGRSHLLSRITSPNPSSRHSAHNSHTPDRYSSRQHPSSTCLFLYRKHTTLPWSCPVRWLRHTSHLNLRINRHQSSRLARCTTRHRPA